MAEQSSNGFPTEINWGETDLTVGSISSPIITTDEIDLNRNGGQFILRSFTDARNVGHESGDFEFRAPRPLPAGVAILTGLAYDFGVLLATNIVVRDSGGNEVYSANVGEGLPIRPILLGPDYVITLTGRGYIGINILY